MVGANHLGIKCSECNRDTYVLYLSLLYDTLAQMQLQVCFVFNFPASICVSQMKKRNKKMSLAFGENDESIKNTVY